MTCTTVIIRHPMDIIVSLQKEGDLTSKEMFSLVEAIDAYEVKEEVQDEIVIDITEINKDGMLVIHIDPKKKIPYQKINDHLECMLQNGIKESKIKLQGFQIIKLLFRTQQFGVPSNVINGSKPTEKQLQKMRANDQQDEMKSYH